MKTVRLFSPSLIVPAASEVWVPPLTFQIDTGKLWQRPCDTVPAECSGCGVWLPPPTCQRDAQAQSWRGALGQTIKEGPPQAWGCPRPAWDRKVWRQNLHPSGSRRQDFRPRGPQARASQRALPLGPQAHYCLPRWVWTRWGLSHLPPSPRLPHGKGVSALCLSHRCILEAHILFDFTGSHLERNLTSG